MIKIYTDGSCSPNPGAGGWGAVIFRPSPTSGKRFRKELRGGEHHTTSSRMELTAVIEAIASLGSCGQDVEIYTDSRYVKDGILRYLATWKYYNWITSSGGHVKNRDLWESLETGLAIHKVEWGWVKGHNGHPHNERADRLATEGRLELPDDIPW